MVLSHLAFLTKNLKFKRRVINALKNLKKEKFARCERSLFLANSKRDQRGKGSYRFINDTTINLISEWCEEFNVYDHFLLRPCHLTKPFKKRGLTT